MSTVHFRFLAFAAAFSLISPALSQAAGPLKPFKDELFSAQILLDQRDGGDFRHVDYQEMRDINGRDQIPEKRVKSAYVSLGVRKAQANETLALPSGPLDVFRAGQATGAAFTVIFIHGRGGDRRLGANDYTFGGNFNRLKNLAVENGGVYYAPSVKSFDSAGAFSCIRPVQYITGFIAIRLKYASCSSLLPNVLFLIDSLEGRLYFYHLALAFLCRCPNKFYYASLFPVTLPCRPIYAR